MSAISNKVHLAEYLYDFAVDGGVKDVNINLHAKDNKSAIPVGAIIKGVTSRVLTAVSGTSSTVSWGTDADEDGYSGTTIAEATLVQGFVSNGWDLAAPLLWDDTNDHAIYIDVDSAADGEFVVLISTANLTAGKIWFGVEYIMPSELE